MCKKICSECKKAFTPYHKKQVTCGSDLCKKSRKNNLRKVDLIDFYCSVCGDAAIGNKNSVLCGKKECRQKYVNDFNIKGKYKEKLRESVNKYAKVSGAYSYNEIITMLKLKAKGKTHGFIAKKLKRKLDNVDKKIRNILNDDKFTDIYDGFLVEYSLIVESKAKKRDIDYWNDKVSKCF